MTETAMMLTQEQWDDMAAICRLYLQDTAIVVELPSRPTYTNILRRRALCDRIVDACEL